MSLFVQRYRELSKVSSGAFWTGLVTAIAGLVLTVFRHASGYESGSLEALSDVLFFLTLLSMGVMAGTLRRDRRRSR